MYKLATFVNLESVDQVKAAMFEAGAGRIGNYDMCCFATQGKGQFRPLKGSHPTIGTENRLEYIDEVKIELVVSDELIKEVLKALKKSHPYETPAYEVYRLEEFL